MGDAQQAVEQLRETGSFVIPADWDLTFGELDDICRAAGVTSTTIEAVGENVRVTWHLEPEVSG